MNAPHEHPDLPLEQHHLDGTVQNMIDRIALLEDRERNAGADLETSLTLADNSYEQAAVLSPHVHEPYFASLSCRIAGQDKVMYIGKHAHGDFGGPHSVISWESQVGGLFYSDERSWTPPVRTGGRSKPLTGTVTRKRQIGVSRKCVTGVTDLYDAAGQDTGARERVLIDRLSEAATSGMREIVQTLQPDQHAAVRGEAGVNLVVQGSAGSGKTTIGFHRLVWLAHPERREHRADPARCLVLMPNQVLAEYAARVLPGLNLEGVRVTTPEVWMLGFLNLSKMTVSDRTLSLLMGDRDGTRRAAAWRRAKLLGSLRMLEVVKHHLHLSLLKKAAALSLRTRVVIGGETRTLTVDAEALSGLLRSVIQRSPLEGYRPALRQRLSEHLADQLNMQDEAELRELNRQLDAELGSLTGKIFSSFTPVTEARRLLASESLLRQAGEGLLSETDFRVALSDPLAGVAKPKHAGVDVTELPLMLALRAYTDGIGRRDGHSVTPYDSLTLDEAQDFSPAFYALLKRAVRPGHLTALGDLAQGVHGYRGLGKWDELQDAVGGAQVLTLSRTYRSTKEISEVTAQIASTYRKEAVSGHVERYGEPVSYLSGAALPVLTARAVKAMQAAGHVNIAVVTRRTAEALALVEALQSEDVNALPIVNEEARYMGGTVVVPVNLAKGLEFDGCVVVGADAQTYDPVPEYEIRLLFVASTRGLHALTFVSEGALHPLIETIRSGLAVPA